MAGKSVSQGMFGGFVDLTQRQFIQVLILGGVGIYFFGALAYCLSGYIPLRCCAASLYLVVD